MPSDIAQGTTLSFGGAVNDVQRISFNENGNPVDVTDLSDTVRKFLNGITSYEMSVTVTGVSSINTATAAAAISIAWNDGTTDTAGGIDFICTSANRSGGVGEAITTELTFAPSA